MSTRGSKKRGRPPKVPTHDRKQKFQYQLLKKPKYLQHLGKGSDSPASTPSASRASSPQVEAPRSARGRRARGKRRGGVSVPAGAYQRRGYNPQASEYLDSEYHYGSDFGDESSEKSEPEDELPLSPSDSDDSMGGESHDSDFSLSSFSTVSGTQKRPRPPTPEPIWLQNRPIPPLELPKSSEDLLVPAAHVMVAVSIYEVLRHFRNLVRLSPFRLEDFCTALVCDDQSNLFAEVHIMLLKALLREEDSQLTHFGPLDQKDSVNISLYLIDYLTWPEALRSYVESDPSFDQEVMRILNTCEYPFTTLENKLKVLQFLTDLLLTTNPVREDLISEVPMHYDDHCRVCHKLGDLLCCETCPAVFHLECVDPPLVDVPVEDWQCNICRSHKVSGVVDCVLDVEKQGQLCRQDHLGFDRFGRKYFFLCRRIFIENVESNEIWYYTSKLQLENLILLLDECDMEADLCRELNDLRDEIERQMELTEKLTNQYKGSKKSYLETENAQIAKLRNDEDVEDDDDNDDDKPEIKSEADAKEYTMSNSIDVKSEAVDSPVKSEECDEDKEAARAKSGSLGARTKGADSSDRLTRLKSLQMANGTLLYKLGMENHYKTYVNQFTSNIIALNKPQRNEERDKKRHLSHKFSLTPASEFKWNGSTTGNKGTLTHTLRQTILQLEQSIQLPFMHPNWHLLKKTWLSVINQCQKPSDFAKALIVLYSCIKPCVFANVWHEQLGHVKLVRATAADREERKKLEKREKKERDEEEERNRLMLSYVKYTMSFRHQLWKQKGEEYRIHGRWGWIWYSTARTVTSQDSNSMGLAGGAAKIMLHVRDKSVSKIIAVNREMYTYLKKHCVVYKRKGDEIKDEPMELEQDDKQDKDPLSDLQLQRPVKHCEHIDVCKALTTPGRILYPRVAKKSKLDDLLTRRTHLKAIEERKLGQVKTENAAEEQDGESEEVDIENIAQELSVDKLLNNLIVGKMPIAPAPVNKEVLNSIAKKIQQLRLHYASISKIGKEYQCYSKGCNSNTTTLTSSCYSPICLQRNKVRKELLCLLRKANIHTNPKLTNLLANANAAQLPNALKKSMLEHKLASDNHLQADSNAIADLPAVLAQAVISGAESFSAMVPLKVEPEEVADEPFDCDDYNEHNQQMGHAAASNAKTTHSSRKRKRDSKQPVNNILEDSSSSGDVEVDTLTEDSSTMITVTRSSARNHSDASKRKSMRNAGGETTPANGRTIQTLNAKSGKYKAQFNRRFCTSGRTFPKSDDSSAKSEKSEGDVERVYSSADTSGKVYLKRIGIVGQEKHKKKSMIKYPLNSTFATRKNFRSILVLPRYESRKLARQGGRFQVNGFNLLAKSNSLVWPYPCARPFFKTCWIFRTVNIRSIASAALQLRILWACLRWDDMQVKPQNSDGKHQITTETEILSLELLKHRHVGPFMEKTQYLRRKVVIPLELPKTVREVTSIRSGLRKRKRPESPQSTDPQVTEEWVDDDKLELWEIKQYGEKLEKVTQQVITRSRTGNLPPARVVPDTVDSPIASKVIVTTKQGAEDFKEKMEQQLRLQRAAHQQKRALELKNAQGQVLKMVGATAQVTPDGKMQLVKNLVLSSQSGKTLTSLLSANNAAGGKQFTGRRIFMTKNADGTTRMVAGATPVVKPTQNLLKLPTGQIVQTTTNATPSTPTAAKAVETTPQRVQIMRTPDGRLTVKGLLPGQQLVQMPDGKLQVLSTTPVQTPKTAVSTLVSTLATTAAIKPSAAPATPIATVNKLLKTSTGKVILQQQAPKVSAGLAAPPPKQIIIKPPTSLTAKAATAGSVLVSGNQVIQQVIANATPAQQVLSNQIVINNQNLTQPLSMGKVQVASINGQQVLIRQTGNNQAQIVAQFSSNMTPAAQAVVAQQAKLITQPQLKAQPVAAPAKPPEAPKQDNAIDPVTMQQLLVGQPVGTVIKCVTAQVIQTQQGPRIVLQGLQGADFTSQQLAAVQQQVKQQLLKAQATTGKQGVLGPTKIYLAVQPNNVEVAEARSAPPPLAMVNQQARVQPENHVSAQGNTQQVEQRQVIVNGQQQSSSTSAILQAMKSNMMESSSTSQSTAVSTPSVPASVLTGTLPAQENKQFVVTPDYIQQTIRTALKQENLNPEIEEKLLQLQRYQEKQMKQEPEPLTARAGHNLFRTATLVNATRKRPASTSRLEDEDEDWVMETPKRSRSSKLIPEPIIKREPITHHSESVKEKPISPRLKKQPVKDLTPEQRAASVKTKMMVSLYRQKELLKKDILRKRALLEKELQFDIQKEISEELALRAKLERTAKQQAAKQQQSEQQQSEETKIGSSRRKANATAITTTPVVEKPTPHRNKRSGHHKVSSSPNKSKKEKLYCTCRTPYDETKFYVGCDLCNNWFHGECVGITEESSKNMSEFICNECKHARETQELFCLCRQPYDESQFYICCDRCQDWFHGRCVGILQSEADNIDEYICPNCQKNSSVNYANMKDLSNKNFDELRRLIKQIQAHKSAWPFVEPVDPTEAPDYYKVIKEPMDLQKIENKINERTYNKLSEFIGDMTKIFDNCRYYNPKESQFFKCAESLEAYFVNKIKSLREKLYDT